MKPRNEIAIQDRILGGLWGAVVGDALGVPVEFQSRSEVRQDPVTDMRGHGTYNQPAGTWSDDSSLLLCTADSLASHGFDTADMGRRLPENWIAQLARKSDLEKLFAWLAERT